MATKIMKIHPYFSDYSFLKLYCAYSTIEEDFPIIYNDEFSEKLYEYYKNSKLHNLFRGMSFIKNTNEKKGYIDMTRAFMIAYTLGLLAQVSDRGKLRSIVLLNKLDAQKIISETDEDILEKMDILFSSIKVTEDKNPIKTKIYKIGK